MNNNKNVLFVDCFNTIIGRRKTPNDVLLDWGEQMNGRFPQIESIQFYRLFKSCWKNLENDTILKTENSEFLVNINDIFLEVFKILKQYFFISNIKQEDFLQYAKNCYYTCEHNSHFLKQRTLKFIKKWAKNGKKCYIVSDFYCEKQVVQRWLEDLGFELSLVDDIFVSCDVGASKKSGSIYKLLLTKLNLNSNQVLMMGDNIQCDIFMARRYGLNTKWIFPQIKRDCKKLRHSKTNLIIPQEFQAIFDENIENGSFSNYAFLLFMFVKRLAYECEKNNIKKLYFFAREGQFLKTLFDEYCNFNNLEVSTEYMIVSRKSCLNASILPYNIAFDGLMNKKFVSVFNFLKTLNFDEEQMKSISKTASVSLKHICFQLGSSSKIKKVTKSQEFEKIYSQRRLLQHENFVKYLGLLGIDRNSGGAPLYSR